MAREAHDFLPLHPLELRILLSLLDGPSYGTRIVADIEAREGPDATIYPANLYRRIRNLLGDGLVEDAPAPPDADPRRIYLRITALGQAVAVAEAERLKTLLADVAKHRLLPEAP